MQTFFKGHLSEVLFSIAFVYIGINDFLIWHDFVAHNTDKPGNSSNEIRKKVRAEEYYQ